MAGDRDLHAARLSRQGWSYTEIATHLSYPDRRAAHRGVQRGLAEVPAEKAQLRALGVQATDERLVELQRALLILLDQHEPDSWDTGRGSRTYLRIMDTLFRVLTARCKLHGLFTHPYRHDLWWRRDAPLTAWLPLQLRSARLERQARIPVRWRPVESAPRELAPVLPLRPVSVLIDVESLVPATVRRLLDRVA